MILDSHLTIADTLPMPSIAGGEGAASQAGSNLDLKQIRDVGAGSPQCVVVTINTAPTGGGGNLTHQFVLLSSTAENLLTGTFEQILMSAAFGPSNTLATNDRFVLPIPPLIAMGAVTDLGRRYYGVGILLAGSVDYSTIGTYSIVVQPWDSIQDGPKAYPDSAS